MILNSFKKNLAVVLLFSYAILLFININSVQLFVSDEPMYSNSVYSVIDGKFNSLYHPFLATTIWAFFVYSSHLIFAIDEPVFWRIGTILFSLGTIIIFYKIANLFFSKKVSLLACVILALDPMYFVFSRLVQLDVIALFFTLSALYYLILYSQKPKLKKMINAGLLGGFSLAVKMSALAPLISIPILIILLTFKKKKIHKSLLTVLLYYFLLFLGFFTGNLIFFFIHPPMNFFQFIIFLIKSQLDMPKIDLKFHQSPAWSWFIIPQILSLMRLKQKENVISFFVLQNPFLFASALISLITNIFLTVKNRLKRIPWIIILFFFFGLYLPWFLNLRSTYYYYIIPLTPLIILFLFRCIEQIKPKRIIYSFLLTASIIIFIACFPFLTGIKVNKLYDRLLFSFSLYKFSPKDTLFCQKCFPRD